MYGKDDSAFDMYYAYLKKETNDFGSAHVTLTIGNDEIFLTIEVSEPILIPDLEGLLSNLQTNVFKRLRVDIMSEFKVLLYFDGTCSIVSLEKEDNEFKVVSITPISTD